MESAIIIFMKSYNLLFVLAMATLWSGCSSTGQDIKETPVGSVLSGETKDADAYLQRVEQENAAKTQDAAQNQMQYDSHERSNFFRSEERY